MNIVAMEANTVQIDRYVTGGAISGSLRCRWLSENIRPEVESSDGGEPRKTGGPSGNGLSNSQFNLPAVFWGHAAGPKPPAHLLRMLPYSPGELGLGLECGYGALNSVHGGE